MEINSKGVYAVIVSRNGVAWIGQAIESLQGSTFPVRIVVVDNASTDETVANIRDFYHEVEVFCMPDNLGFAKANNHGIRYALSQGADYILLLNQDAKVDPSMIGSLVNLLDTHPEIGIISPLHLDYQGREIDPWFLQHIRDDGCLMSDAFFEKLHDLYEVQFANAAVWLVTRRVFKEVGGFDPLFFMYGEDQDYCQRVRYHGFKVALSPKAKAYHWHGGSVDKSFTFSEQCIHFYAEMLHRLKRPERFFVRSLLSLLPTWNRRSIIMLIDLNFKGFFAIVLSFFKVVSNFFRIWRHHSRCKRRGSYWL